LPRKAAETLDEDIECACRLPRSLVMLVISGATRLNRVVLAFRCLSDILFRGRPSDTVISALALSTEPANGGIQPAAAVAEVPVAKASEGALQILSILQRDSRLLDFLMEDVAGYSDGQIGAVARALHDQCRESVSRYVTLQPVIEGVEGTFTRAPSTDADLVKFIGNVPAQLPSGGILRHKGWRAAKVDLPTLGATADVTVLAPAEIEIE
jgi:uncharacterized protein DUF2760